MKKMFKMTVTIRFLGSPGESTTRLSEFNDNDKEAFTSSGKHSKDDAEQDLGQDLENENRKKLYNKIGKFRELRKKTKSFANNLVVIKRSNKVAQAMNLPKVLNLNPRSIYNKSDEFVTFVKEEEVDLICLSESWEREELPLDELINIDDYNMI